MTPATTQNQKCKLHQLFARVKGTFYFGNIIPTGAQTPYLVGLVSLGEGRRSEICAPNHSLDDTPHQLLVLRVLHAHFSKVVFRDEFWQGRVTNDMLKKRGR